MRFFKVFVIIFFAIVVLWVNGISSAVSWCLAVLILWLGFNERYSFFYVLIFIISLGLSMNSIFGSVSNMTNADEMKVYQTGVERGLMFNVAECTNFYSIDVGQTLSVKEELYNDCALQTPRNMIIHFVDFVSVFYSGLYTEAAIAFPLFPQKKINNKCLNSINKMIKLCPGESVYYDKKILSQLNQKYEIQ